MSLTPLPNTLGVVGPAEVIAIGRLVQPSSLAGQFAGLSARRLAAVMLMMLVAVIGEEKIATTVALTSLGLQGHRGRKRPRPGRKEKPNARRGRRTRNEEGRRAFSRSSEENPAEENTISNRRCYCIFIPPLTTFDVRAASYEVLGEMMRLRREKLIHR